MIKAVIIDDDKNLRNGLKSLLSRYAPQIEIIGEAESVATGVEIMLSLQPQVVFLDIQMNDGTGFDLLDEIRKSNKEITSNIVFITAHEQFAIKAFRFSALDFLLKPIDPDELEIVIEKIISVVGKNEGYAHIDLLLENMRKKEDKFKRIALSNSLGTFVFELSDIIRCESDDNYTKFYIKNRKTILISKTLKEFDELLSENGFERVHQSHLINMSYIKSYTKEGTYATMIDDSQVPVSKRKRDRLQELLKKILKSPSLLDKGLGSDIKF